MCWESYRSGYALPSAVVWSYDTVYTYCLLSFFVCKTWYTYSDMDSSDVQWRQKDRCSRIPQVMILLTEFSLYCQSLIQWTSYSLLYLFCTQFFIIARVVFCVYGLQLTIQIFTKNQLMDRVLGLSQINMASDAWYSSLSKLYSVLRFLILGACWLALIRIETSLICRITLGRGWSSHYNCDLLCLWPFNNDY